MNTLQQKIESLLFYRNEPVSFLWLAKQLDVDDITIEEELYEMMDYYDSRGIQLVISDNKAFLMTSKIAQDIIQRLSRSDEERELSKQALETLAIILYKGMITKAEIDYIRGVNSLYILRNLLIRGLIEKNINKEDKRSPLYSLTHDALSFLGVRKKEELEHYKNFKEKLDEIEKRFNEELQEGTEKTEETKEEPIDNNIQSNIAHTQ